MEPVAELRLSAGSWEKQLGRAWLYPLNGLALWESTECGLQAWNGFGRGSTGSRFDYRNKRSQYQVQQILWNALFEPPL